MRYIFCLISFLLTACGVNPPSLGTALPPLEVQIQCLPKETAIISAHRGTAKDTSYAENSIEGLKHLIAKGYIMAETDVSRLKDGTHILYHDGVWEDGSTGNGIVAATTWEMADTFILKDTRGRFTSQKIPKLSDYLAMAKDKIYLEIDFKSSANYSHVIDQIRKYKMSGHVILISYNPKQAQKLSQLAPEMLISVSIQNTNDIKAYSSTKAAAWLNKELYNKVIIHKLDASKIPIIGKVGPDWSEEKAKIADILVTDYALNHRPITGLTRGNIKPYEACLTP